MKYHPIWTKILTFRPESTGGTVIGGQFDWGGSLLKNNEGVQRFTQDGRQSSVECKSISEPDCESDRTSRHESGV